MELTKKQAALCKQCGVDPKDFLATLRANASATTIDAAQRAQRLVPQTKLTAQQAKMAKACGIDPIAWLETLNRLAAAQ